MEVLKACKSDHSNNSAKLNLISIVIINERLVEIVLFSSFRHLIVHIVLVHY